MTDSSTPLYRVRGWDRLYENNKTRALKSLSWLPLPNKHDGEGYLTLVNHRHGAAHYGGWIAILQVASKCDPRGTLVRDCGQPHTPETIGLITKLSVPLLRVLLPRLVSPIRWLEVVGGAQVSAPAALTEIGHDSAGIGHDGAGIGHDSALKERKKEGKEGKEGKGKNARSDGIEPCRPHLLGERGHIKLDPTAVAFVGITNADRSRWAEAYPAVDLDLEPRWAAEWAVTNLSGKGRKADYGRFLVSWLRRSQERGGSHARRRQAGGDPKTVYGVAPPLAPASAEAQERAERWLLAIPPDDFPRVRLELWRKVSEPVEAGRIIRARGQQAIAQLVRTCPALVALVLERAD